MGYGFKREVVEFKAPVDIKVNDIVWVKWLRYRSSDAPAAATPTRVLTIYPDGNLIHKRSGSSGPEFAWAKDVVAKTNDINLAHMAFRTTSIVTIEKYIKDAKMVGVSNAA